MSRKRRCLLVECLPYHWEVLPHWVGLLERLGYEVDVAAAGGTAGHRETLALLRSRCRTHEPGEIRDLPLHEFDFVLVNSLVHDGYFFADRLDPRPNLAWIESLGLPSISVIHEPIHWVEKRVAHGFDEIGPSGRRRLGLLVDGCFQYDGGFWSPRPWALADDRLLLPEGGRVRIFESTDGGRSYEGLGADDGTRLLRRADTAEDPARHCAGGRHAVVALTEPAAAHLARVCDSIDWLLPFEIQERLASRATGGIAFAGTIDYDRKAIPSLLQGCTALRDGQRIGIIGGSRDAAFDQDRTIRQFKAQIAEAGLGSCFDFTGYLPYGDFVEAIRPCRFLLALVDDYVDSGHYLLKLPAIVASSLGLGVPMILNRTVAARFGLDYMICYPGDDLASGLRAAEALSPAAYGDILAALDRQAASLDRRNLRVLSGLIDRILSKHAA